MLKAGSNAASPVAQGLGLVQRPGSQRAEALWKIRLDRCPDDDEGTSSPTLANAIHTLLTSTLAFGRAGITSLKRIRDIFSGVARSDRSQSGIAHSA